MAQEVLKFTKIRTTTDPTFWAKFAELKLDKIKLDEKSEINLWGSYLSQSTNNSEVQPLKLDYTSFNETVETTSHQTNAARYGCIINTNTYEAFRQVNPQTLIDSVGKQIIQLITSGEAVKDTWKLTFFIVFSYADLKKYRFHYWVAHPTPFRLPEIYNQEPAKSAKDILEPKQIEELDTSIKQLDCKNKNYFSIIINTKGDIRIVNLTEAIEFINIKCQNEEKQGTQSEEIYFGFYDPCRSTQPGWPLRNLLCLLFYHCTEYCFKESINILSFRGNTVENSIFFKLKAKNVCDIENAKKSIFENQLVGWETNSNGKMGPNIADLSNSIDPVKLSERAINLNLKLMKWRLVPDVNLESISGLKCLLLGAGTLGCAVARVLIGWAVKNIVFVDNSTVSHSNTVRQSLYTHQDAVERRYKAHAATEALLKIRPSLNVKGEVLHIPMPGHVVGPSMLNSTREAAQKLEELIAQSDVVFLLLDSREARWLPTLLCAAMDKIVINAALGFDSYTVQRHGTRKETAPLSPNLTLHNPSGQDLGCYFCNDITQPGNSQTDRTLDQQCTVSRPGLSQIAAGIAVELLISLTQHPEGVESKALMNNNSDESHSNNQNKLYGLLGGVPHTIRGSLWNHDMRLTVTHRFSACTACSSPLIKEYKDCGFDFILNACNTPGYLEKLSGLDDLLKRPDLDDLCYAIDTSSDDED